MPYRSGWILGLLAKAVLVAASFGSAPTGRVRGAESVPDVSPPAAGGVQEVKPETLYFRDKDGRLVPVPNLPFEELDRLLQQDLKLTQPGPALPAYALQDLSISGTADQRQADLTVVFGLRVQTPNWVRIPLRFAEAVLREPARHEGEADSFLDYDKDQGGYVCWLRAAADKRQTLSLHFTVPVREVGNELRLALQTPRATSSLLDLRVAMADATAVVTSGVLEVKKQAQETQLLVAGLGGDFQIAWRKGESRPVPLGPLLEVRSETLVKIEGLRQVSADVRLKVSSLRGEFAAFLVHLPTGTRLFPRQFSQPGLQITELNAADESAPKTVQVKLDRPTVGPVEVQLLTELAPAGDAKTPEFTLSGWEVEDAVRHAGTLDFAIKGDWLVTWKPGANVQRTFVPEALKQKVAARFEFARRTFSLLVQIAPKETEVSVEPVYVLHVESSRVRLEAILKYKIRGTGIYGVNIQFPGWRVNDLQPVQLIELENLDRQRLEPLFVPLTAQTVSGGDQFQLRIFADQDLPSSSSSLAVTLPRAEAKTMAPATVVVVPADNVELTVDEAGLQGLERESVPPAVDLPARQQPPLFFRERSDSKPSVFAAALKTRTRALALSLANSVHLDAARIRVDQRWSVRILYEPLKNLLLDVPAPVLATGKLRILAGDQPLPFAEQPPADAAPAAGAAPPRIQVDFPAEQIGTYEFTVQYEVPQAGLAADREVPVAVPLVTPSDDEPLVLAENKLLVQTGANLRFRHEADGWEAVEDRNAAAGDGASGLTLSSRDLLPAARFQVRGKEPQPLGATAVRRAWLQCWLAAHGRRDRAAFQVATSHRQLRVRLPEGAALEALALDGQAVPGATADAAGDVVVELPEEPAAEEHRLELWYSFGPLGTASGRWQLATPRIADAKWTNKWYWQLALPADVHLVLAPQSMTPEYHWERRGLSWGRRAELRQAELEQWAGATSQDPLPDALNEYLFSSFGEVGDLPILTAPRWLLLLVASGVVLLAGLLLMYVAVVRHPLALVGLGLGLATVALAAPDFALLAGQAAGLGVALLVLARLLKALVDWRQMQGTVVRGVSLAGSDSKTVRANLPPPEVPAFPASTAAHIPLPTPAAEPRP